MNIVLFERAELTKVLPPSDVRAAHIVKILKKSAGDEVVAGVIDGEEGAARIECIDGDGVHFTFRALHEGKKPLDIVIMMASVRPIQAKRLVKSLASIGVCRLIFTPTAMGEKSYLNSAFYQEESGEMRKKIIEGASQAGSTHLMKTKVFSSFKAAADYVSSLKSARYKAALDNVRPVASFHSLLASEVSGEGGGLCIAVGGERGWTESERDELERRHFTLCSFGERILTAETAAIGAACAAASFFSSNFIRKNVNR